MLISIDKNKSVFFLLSIKIVSIVSIFFRECKAILVFLYNGAILVDVLSIVICAGIAQVVRATAL